MSRLLFVSISLVLLIQASVSSHALPTLTGQVDQVYDGDTIRVGRTKIRLLGIDSPEIRWEEKNKVEECFAQEAKKYLIHLILNQKIQLVFDKQADKVDAYNRALAYVRYHGVNINEHLVEKGYAFVFRRYPFSKKERFLKLEKLAKKKKIGVWGKCAMDCSKGYCEVKK